MKKVKRLDDPDLRGAEKAIKRAAQRARDVAEATNTPLVIMEKGKIVYKRVVNGKIDLDPE